MAVRSAEPGTAAGALLWGATGGVGFIAQDGRFRALRPGVGTVRAWDGASFRESPVTVNPPRSLSRKRALPRTRPGAPGEGAPRMRRRCGAASLTASLRSLRGTVPAQPGGTLLRAPCRICYN
jgi:hypothetical protein